MQHHAPESSACRWSIDLGPECTLACNYYTLRADGSLNFPRDWVLQVGQPWSNALSVVIRAQGKQPASTDLQQIIYQ